MATTPLDSFQTTSDAYPANFPISAGSNRKAYLAVIRTSGTDANPPTSASIGGVSVSPLAVADNGADLDVVIALFEWTEAQIASMSGSAVTVTGGAGANYATIYWSVQGATQGATSVAAKASAATTADSVSLTRDADSYTVGLTVHDISSGAYTSMSNPSQTGTFNITNGVIAYGGEADTARTASFSWTHGSSRENAMIVINIAPATSLNAIGGSGSASASGSGAIATPGISFTLRDTDTAQLKNGVTYANIHAVNAASRGAIAASLTSKATNSVGVMTLRAPGISVIGATYDVVGWSSDGSDRFHASAVCADM